MNTEPDHGPPDHGPPDHGPPDHGPPDHLPPIRREILVDADPATAFEVFTDRIGQWWPLEDLSVYGAGGTVGFADGRIVERSPDGEATVWGTVTRWEPATALAFTWHPGGPPDQASNVEVTFTAADSQTLVALTHGTRRLRSRGTSSKLRCPAPPKHLHPGLAATRGSDRRGPGRGARRVRPRVARGARPVPRSHGPRRPGRRGRDVGGPAAPARPGRTGRERTVRGPEVRRARGVPDPDARRRLPGRGRPADRRAG